MVRLIGKFHFFLIELDDPTTDVCGSVNFKSTLQRDSCSRDMALNFAVF